MTDESAEPLETSPVGGADPSQSAEQPSFAENLADETPSITRRDHEAAIAAETEKALKEWKDKHGWAESVTPDQRAFLSDLATRAQTDPVGLASEMLAFAARNPRYRRQVENLIGGLAPRQASASTPTAADEEPQPDLQLPDGRLLYSADQLAKWHQWSDKQSEKRLAERLKPYDEMKARLEEQTRLAESWQSAVGTAQAFKPYLESLPGFTEHKDKIIEVYQGMKFENEQQAQMGIMAAYHEVVLPKLQANGQSAAVADHARRAAATTARPVGTQTGGSKAKTIPFAEALAQEWRIRKTGS